MLKEKENEIRYNMRKKNGNIGCANLHSCISYIIKWFQKFFILILVGEFVWQLYAIVIRSEKYIRRLWRCLRYSSVLHFVKISCPQSFPYKNLIQTGHVVWQLRQMSSFLRKNVRLISQKLRNQFSYIQTDGLGSIDSARHADHLYIIFTL